MGMQRGKSFDGDSAWFRSCSKSCFVRSTAAGVREAFTGTVTTEAILAGGTSTARPRLPLLHLGQQQSSGRRRSGARAQ